MSPLSLKSSPTNVWRILRSARGAFDLPSILVGVVVVGILTAGVLASVFGVIPFAQDNGAKQDLSAVRTAEGVAKAKDGRFMDGDGLKGASYINLPDSVVASADASGSCYVAITKSGTGKFFFATSLRTDPQPYTSDTDTGCLSSAEQQSLAAKIGTAPEAAPGSPAAAPSFNTLTVAPLNTGVASANWRSAGISDDGRRMFLGGNGPVGSVMMSNDAGATWTKSVGSDVNGGARTGLVVNSDGTMISGSSIAGSGFGRSTDGGMTWTNSSSMAATSFYGIAGSSDGTKLVLGDSASTNIYTSSDSGATWTTRPMPGTGGYWYGFASSADGRTLVAGQNLDAGGVYISRDFGVSWAKSSLPAGKWTAIASSADGTKLTAGQYPGALWTSSDSGLTWAKTAAPNANWIGISASADGTKLVAAQFGGFLYASKDSGVTWTPQTSAGSANWLSTAATADGSKWIAANNTGGVVTGTYGP